MKVDRQLLGSLVVGLVGGLIGSSIPLLIARFHMAPECVRSHEFALVDNKGVTRAQLHFDKEDHPVLHFNAVAKDGKHASVSLGITTDKGSSREYPLLFMLSDEVNVASLDARPDGPELWIAESVAATTLLN